MVKKTLGYVELEWTCPRCGSRNPGPDKTCNGCGAPQPDDVEFEQAAQEELVTEEKAIKRAKAGPDVHCAYCGARNRADAEICTQCGADLTEAEARVSGQVVGAHRREPVPDVACPACGALNPASAHECSQCGATLARPEPKPAPRSAAKPAARAGRGGCGPIALVAGVGLILLVILGIFLTRPSGERAATVEDVSWTRSVPIMGLVPVAHEGWYDEVPQDAVLGDCRQEPHHVQDSPAPNAREICGTPYTVDTGSGYGEVVQDCRYEVYEDWCEYQVEEWQVVDQVVQSGSDLNPRWPVTQLDVGQRKGEGEERYEVVFDTDGGTYSYITSDPAEFAQFRPGSQWLLKVNKLGAVVDVEPVR
jgi:ribosomal protein L40E